MYKTEMMRARCTELEKAALVAIAAQDRDSPASVLRNLVVQEAKRRGLWRPHRRQAQEG